MEQAGKSENVVVDAVSPQVYTFENLVRSIRREVESHALLVHIHPRMAELASLALRPLLEDVLLTRDEILKAVWGYHVAVTDRSVDRCVATLREQIEADPRHPVFVQTIRDVGYRFEAADLRTE